MLKVITLLLLQSPDVYPLKLKGALTYNCKLRSCSLIKTTLFA